MQDVPSFTAAQEAPADSDLALASPTADSLTLADIEALHRRHRNKLVLTYALVRTNVFQ
jgi:hypothetical protein